MEPPQQQALLPQDRKKSTGSYLKKRLMVALVLTLYVCAAMSTFSLQSQYVLQRLLQQNLNSTNATMRHSSCTNASLYDIAIFNRVQKEATQSLLLFQLSGAIPSVLVNLLYGSYSDYLGRKILFFMPLLGAFINYSIYALIMKFDLSLNIFFIGNAINGVSGSFTTIILAGFAYTADITPSHTSRTVGIAVIESILAIGASLGSLMTGFLISSLGFFYLAVITTAIVGLDLIIVVFFLPETLQKVDQLVLSPFVHLKKIFGFFTIYGTRLKRVQYNLCLLALVFGIATQIGSISIETLYQLGLPFCWSSLKIGYFGALRVFFRSTFSTIVIKILQPCLRDEIVAILGLVFAIGSAILEAFASTDLMMYMVPLLAAASGTTVPIFRSIASRMTSPKDQGAIFASIAVLETLTGIVFTSMFNAIYEATIATLKGTVFIYMAALSAFAIIIVIIFMVVSRGRGAANLQHVQTLVVNTESPGISGTGNDDEDDEE